MYTSRGLQDDPAAAHAVAPALGLLGLCNRLQQLQNLLSLLLRLLQQPGPLPTIAPAVSLNYTANKSIEGG